jgi:UDP-N-acetylglucosamine 4-epimerase
MKILVTGGAGFIGSHICDFLLNKNIKVRVLDNLSTGNKNNICHHENNPNFEFLYGDITNLEIVRKACDGINAICHQAALGSVPRSINDPLSSHNTNVNGFLNILIGAKENNIKRIVYATSSSVYGDNADILKTETNIGMQLSPYAITKYINELYSQNFTKLYGLECIGLRYFNVFGPRQNPNGEYAAVIPKFIHLIKNNIQPKIYGDGTITRDFTYIDNVVMANYLSLTTTNNICFGKVFNIGSSNPISINDMVNFIILKLNKNISPIYDLPRIGDITNSCANILLSTTLLNYNVLVNFYDGLQQLLNNDK